METFSGPHKVLLVLGQRIGAHHEDWIPRRLTLDKFHYILH